LNGHFARPWIGIGHRVHAVHRQIQDDLLHLHFIGAHRQRAFKTDRAQFHAALHGLGRQDMNCSPDRLVDVKLLQIDLTSALQQFAKMLDDFRRPLIGLPDIVYNILQLAEVRRVCGQQKLGGFGITENRPKRLIELMRDGR
jgi:hypothetical protein